MSHAILSPSAAQRWLTCTPSARLELSFQDTAGSYAQEGTLAHSIGEAMIRQKQGVITLEELDPFIEEVKAGELGKFYNAEMHEYMDLYSGFVIERFAFAQAHTSDALLFLERKLNLTDYVPEGFGTGDAIIIADHVLEIIDLKYGKGVPVLAEQNKQMMLYSLGALRDFDYMYDIRGVRMTIFQPRLDSISAWEIPVAELRNWAETELKPRAALAFEGAGDFAPGNHCRFCRAKAVCKANASYNLELAVHDFAEPVLLNDDEVADILNRADTFKKWIAGVEEHALHEAVNSGKQWPGYKIVEGKSNRRYTDETQIAEKLKEIGIPEDKIYAPKELLGITAMEKAITKAVFNTHLGPFIVKPSGKPTLVHESDKRPAYNSAKIDFAGIEIED